MVIVNILLDCIFVFVSGCSFLFSIFSIVLYQTASKKIAFIIFLLNILVTMIVTMIAFNYLHFSFIFRMLSVLSITLTLGDIFQNLCRQQINNPVSSFIIKSWFVKE